MIFCKVGATAHTARISLGVLQQMFPGLLVSLRGNVDLPGHYSDISMCDFSMGLP